MFTGYRLAETCPILTLAHITEDNSSPERELLKHIHEFIDKGIVSKQLVLLKIKFVDAIDKTSVGKINKRLLRVKHT